MAEPKKRKGGGSRLSRSQTVTVRLDPKLRYLAELAARKQRRTLSSFIEWAIDESLGHVLLKEERDAHGNDFGISVADETESLWDVDDADRFVKLALRYPEMLTHEEQILWKLIRENRALWRHGHEVNGEWRCKLKEENLIFDRLRKHWDNFNNVARGEADKSVLPTWVMKKVTTTFDKDFDHDIPI